MNAQQTIIAARALNAEHITLLQPSADAGARSFLANPTGFRMVLPQGLHLEKELRLSFRMPDSEAERLLVLANITGSHPIADGIQVSANFVALHTNCGESVLRRFLLEILGSTTVPGRFHPGSGGMFYRFPPILVAAPGDPDKPCAATKQHVEDLAKKKRREARVTVRQTVAWKDGTGTHKGTAYNISKSGAQVRTEGIVPKKGMTVQITYPITMHIRPFRIQLIGKVVWVMDDTSDGAGAFAIGIDRFGEDSGRAAWAEYVDHELRFGGPGGVR